MQQKTKALNSATQTLKRVLPKLKGRKRSEILSAIQALEEEANASKKGLKTNWVCVARMVLFAAEVIKFISE
jgi:hypothetical protein